MLSTSPCPWIFGTSCALLPSLSAACFTRCGLILCKQWEGVKCKCVTHFNCLRAQIDWINRSSGLQACNHWDAMCWAITMRGRGTVCAALRPGSIPWYAVLRLQLTFCSSNRKSEAQPSVACLPSRSTSLTIPCHRTAPDPAGLLTTPASGRATCLSGPSSYDAP